MDGKRRLIGWIDEWPDHPDEGHFVILKPNWLLDDGNQITLEEVESTLVPAADVEFIEFLENEKEQNDQVA